MRAYSSESLRAARLASIMLTETPTVVHSSLPSVDLINTRTPVPVPEPSSSTLTL